jgi:preprotein translocase subunit SecD
VLDNSVLVAPVILARIPGDVIAPDGMIEGGAHGIAAELRTGPLPVGLGVTAARPLRRSTSG